MRYEIKRKEQVFTIPRETITAFALMQQLDKGVTHGKIHDVETAIESLVEDGFEVRELDEKPLSDVPQVPNWYNAQHRDLYDKLFYQKMDRPLTKEEDEFCRRMYHMEEYACGLDG